MTVLQLCKATQVFYLLQSELSASSNLLYYKTWYKARTLVSLRVSLFPKCAENNKTQTQMCLGLIACLHWVSKSYVSSWNFNLWVPKIQTPVVEEGFSCFYLKPHYVAFQLKPIMKQQHWLYHITAFISKNHCKNGQINMCLFCF